jgi:TP901 family phage tail tape measure protein
MAKKISKSDISEEDVFGAIRKSAETTIQIIDKLSASLKETAAAVKQSVGGAKFDSTKAIDNFVKGTQTANKLQKEAIDLDIKRAKAVEQRQRAMTAQQKKLQEQEKTVQQRVRSEEALARQKNRLNKEAERAARLAANESNEYKRLEKRTRELKNQSKRLAAEMLVLEKNGKRNSTEYRKLARSYKEVTREAQNGDKALKNIDATVGDNFRNVGNYTGAVKNLTGTLAKLAGGFSVFQLIRGSFDIVKNFDQAQADLQAISGKTAKELETLTAQAKELGATTQFSATQITEMQIELAKLGFESEQIEASTGAIANFAAATGAAIPDAAALAGSAMRSFGLEASEMERVVSTLGVATTKSALDFGKLQTGLSTVAPVANAFGFSIEDTTALLGQLANAGFDASSAATATRNILLNLADANGDLAQKLGGPVTNSEELAAALQKLKEEGVDLGEALELTDKRSVAAFNTFIEGSDSLVELKDSITDANDELEDMAEKRLDTIGGQFTLLQSAWEGFVLSVNEGSGIGDVVKGTLAFIAENLTRIMSVLGSLIIAWGTYRTTLLAVKAINFIMTGGFRDMIGGMKDSIKNLGKFRRGVQQGGQAVKGFGNSMKSIPFVFIIAGLIEIAKAFFDIATNARQAKEAQDEVNRIEEVNEKKRTERVAKRRKELDKLIAQNERLLRTQKKTEEEVRKLNEDAIKGARDRAKEDRKRVDTRAKDLQKEVDFLERFTEQWNGFMLSSGGMDWDRLADSMKKLGFKDLADDMRSGKVNAGDFNKMITVTKGKIQSAWKSWKVYNEEIEGFNEELKEAETQTFETNKRTADLTASTKGLKDNTAKLNTEFRTQIDLLEEYNELMRDRRELEQDISQLVQDQAIAGVEDQVSEELQVQRNSAETTGEIDVDLLESLIAKKTEMKKAAITEEAEFEIQELKISLDEQQELRRRKLEEEYQKLKAGAKGNKAALEEIERNHQQELVKIKALEEMEVDNAKLEEKKIRMELNGEIEDIERETAEEIKSVNDELIQEQINYSERQKKISLDNLKKISDEEKKLWQDRLDAANVATTLLTELSDRRIAQYDKEIENARKNQDTLRALAENGNIDAKDSLAEAQRIEDEANRKKIEEEKKKQKIEFATIKDVALLQQFISTFTPTFFDGTEDTGSHGQGVDGRGGFHAILHPNERVITKAQNKRIGAMNNEDLALLAENYQNGQLIASNNSQTVVGWDSHLVVEKLMDVKEAIENQPVHNMGVDEVLRDGFNWFSKTQRGSTTIYNRYRVKK